MLIDKPVSALVGRAIAPACNAGGQAPAQSFLIPLSLQGLEVT